MPRHRHLSNNRPSYMSTHKATSSTRRKARGYPSVRIIWYICLVIATSFLLLRGQPSRKSQTIAKGAFKKGPSASLRASSRRVLSYNAANFTLDGNPIRLISGSIHYFRTTPSQWERLLRYALLMGFNAVETYVPWNLHEQAPGKFRFEGILDLRLFLELAHELGLLVLLRPGPYICSEWDLGGLPAYLLKPPSMHLRSNHMAYLEAVERYFEAVAEQIRPYIGRPIVALQLENEFGSYAKDEYYMHWILSCWQRKGFTHDRLLFFTSDNGGSASIKRGSPFAAHVLKTINLDVQVEHKLKVLQDIQPNAPAMITEFWTGWFDHWGERHHVRDGKDVAKNVSFALNEGAASVNLYMFFGGTNFGFMAGANLDSNLTYLPTTTSYDYDAFITEHADIRKEKFLPMQHAIKGFWETIGDHRKVHATLKDPPPSPLLSAYAGTVLLTESIPLYDVLDEVTDNLMLSTYPLIMEEVGTGYGFIMYRHIIGDSQNFSTSMRIVQVSGVRDFAYILADGAVVGTVDRNGESKGGILQRIRMPINTKRLDIIVENRGRVNYGHHIHDRKGILGNVSIDGSVIHDFQNIAISFPQDHPLLPDVHGSQTITKVRNRMAQHHKHPPLAERSSPPTFFRGELPIKPREVEFDGEFPGTYCRVVGRGVLWINGFNVGRFHTGVSGPQRSLFVPGALLREGMNEFMVLHMNMHLTRDPPILKLFENSDFGPPT